MPLAAVRSNVEGWLADPRRILLLDGGLATELESAGCNLSDPLWSGKVLVDEPSQIEAVGLAYLQAGARCLITASYQITPESLMEHRKLPMESASAIIEEAVRVAQAARRRYLREHPHAGPILVAGSVGPYGACLADGSEYRGDYTCTVVEFKNFHRTRISALLRAGADVLAIETQPSASEVHAVVELLQEEFPASRAWVTFTTSRTAPVEAICDGTKWTEILPFLESAPQVVAMGVNCVPMAETSAVLEHLQTLTSMPLVAYPNSGESYNPVTKTWHRNIMPDGTELNLESLASVWAQHGARIIGGCCRTTPVNIRSAAAALKDAGFSV